MIRRPCTNTKAAAAAVTVGWIACALPAAAQEDAAAVDAEPVAPVVEAAPDAGPPADAVPGGVAAPEAAALTPPPEPPLEPLSPEAAQAEIQSLREQLGGYFAASLFGEALQTAQQLLRRVRNEHGEDSLETAYALTDLANVQQMNRQFAESEVTYLRAISIFETNAGIFDPGVVRPRLGLGNTYLAMNRYEDALGVLGEAKYVTHRNFGIFNLQQEDLVDSMTEGYIGAGNLRGAQREQNFYFRANLRTYGEDNPKLVPALLKLARWHERIRDYTRSRQLIEQAVGVLEANYGPNDLRLVQPLNDIARLQHKRRVYLRSGERALQRAVAIHQQQEYGDAVEHGKALARLGDWYILTDRAGEALNYYREAALLTKAVDNDEAEATGPDLFAQPQQLRYVATPPGLGAWELSKLAGRTVTVAAEFTVGADGKPKNIVIVEDDSGGVRAVSDRVKKDIRRSRYRPRIENGVVVPVRMRVRQPLRFERPAR